MHVMTGTSGFSYTAWRGSFYPDKLPPAKMLAFYAGKLGAVEINNTFYRMPTASLLEGWAAQTPDSFRFALKSPQLITHIKKLVEVGDAVARLAEARAHARRPAGADPVPAAAVPEKDLRRARGVPFHIVDAADRRCARRSSSATTSWFADDVYDALRRTTRRCASPTPKSSRRRWRRPPAGATCGCAGRTTTRPRSAAGPSACAAQPFDETFVFFKHEDEGAGPPLAESFTEHDDVTRPGGPPKTCQTWQVSHLGLHWHTPWREQSQARPSRSGLVSIPVKLFAATQASAGVSFNLLHKKCGTRLKQQYICPTDDEIVPRDDMVKGYEFAKDQYVTFTPDELKSLEEKATGSIDIAEFVPLAAIDPVYFDRPYYLGPEKGGDKAYLLLAEAMRETGRAALARYAARGKQYLVMLRPSTQDGRALVLQQLLYADEVRSLADVPLPDGEVREAELKLAKQLIDQIASRDVRPDAIPRRGA